MMHSFKKKRQWIGRGLVFVFLIGIVSSGLILSGPTPVFAVDPAGVTQVVAGAAQGACPTTGAVPTVCPAKGVSETSKSLWDKIITPSLKMVAVKALIDFVSFASNRIAYEAAVYVANGGPGEGSMFYNKSASDAFLGFGKDMGGQAFADLSDITKSSFGLDLCVPPDPFIRLNLQLSIKQNYTPTKPRCDFDSVTTKWGQIVSDASSLLSNDKDARDKFLFNKLSEGLRPGNNQLGASIGFLQLTNETAQRNSQTKTAEQIGSIPIGGFTNVHDLVTGKTTTPAAIVSKQFDDQLKAAKGDQNQIKPADVLANPDVWYGLLNMSVSTFTNTLTSQLFNRVYKGLFSPKPDAADPFNTELAGGSGSDAEANKADLGGIFTATPVANPQYDLLGEFAQCPPDGTGNRSLNSCVIDAGVVAVISRGGSSAALTVQEAIDQKILNGDWPLISSKNASANQDRLCYTYGFCYGNLVKLRKARIIPIGWELAADKNSLNSPKSLKDIVAGFNDCNGQNQMDASHPWCHLIDPNWVLKAPESQCRAAVNGEIRVSDQAAGRQNVCADSPTCIGEDNTGKCTQGFGYCVEEKNIWRVKGDECPSQYATCLTMKNTTTGKANSLLLNTVDNANCTKQNAGCSWNKTIKTPDAKGVFQWYTGAAAYSVAATSSVFRYAGSNAPSYSYEDRLYVTHNAKQCDQAQAGCTELNVKDGKLALNLVQNGSFEKDEDKNGMPDNWANSNVNPVKFILDGNAVDGSKSVQANGGYFYQYVPVTSGSFYTFSFYASSAQVNQAVSVAIFPELANNNKISLVGLSYGGDCTLAPGNQNYDISKTLLSANEWKRFVCTFTLPETAVKVEIGLHDSNGGSPSIQYDAVQLESGEIASNFGDGYNIASPTKAYLKIAPAYLGCKGLASDPKECDAYAQVCSVQDVGCNLFTPKETGPAVPAIASALDACPNECVGYDSYRQEGTKYEPAKFPVYFIADKAGVCSANAVGCDGFTKLGAQGGETQEYYTNLRACLTPEMTTDKTTQTNPTSATYFTWEGSDKSGFQLRTWQLLQSNAAAGALVYTSTPSAFTASPSVGPAHTTETNPNLAPCTKVHVTANDAAACDDLAASHMATVAADASCDEHADIFTNPDCREFFDSTGLVHYRNYSDTVSVDAACVSYRKNTSTEPDCTASGGFWTSQGFCRYFGLQSESKACAASENGCREYTGGAGRNATTILNDTFENGATGSFASYAGTAAPSNDSVSSGGHSLHIIGGGVRTNQMYLGTTYDPAVATTCTNTPGATVVSGGCQLAPGCIVASGKASCGALVDSLARGKVYTLDVWAKGTGNLYAGFSDDGGLNAGNMHVHDLVNTSNHSTAIASLTPKALDPSWKVYHFGPINTTASEFSTFGPNSVLAFATDAGKEIFIDNVQLVQTEENIDRIKDSWVTPSVCDQSPDGAVSPQYYLGCKGYTDRKGVDGSYYQFSHICSEKAIGCSAYYNTYNADSASGQTTNARCVHGTAPNGTADPITEACIVNGTTYCTISAGQNYCVFSTKQVFADPLPSSGGFAIVYGPEAVVTPQDQSVYLVDNGNAQCSVEFKGCREVGAPTYAQDLKTVTKFTSQYIMDTPDDYGNILCENQALFCDEFASTKDGNFYFKDPINKTCEYKTSVTIAQKSFSGWFRSGTSEPCYWTDTNANKTFDPGVDSAYLVSGDQAQIWKNGDTSYDGWVGACDSSANRCTELIDSTDTSPENHGKGKSYYVINNDKLSENSVAVTEKCDGKVGQKAGCALFNNTTISQLKYSSSASYALSLHADLLLNKPQNSLVDPISCTQNGGVFKISLETAKKLADDDAKVSAAPHSASDVSVDLCSRRCHYELNKTGDTLVSPSANQPTAGVDWNERSCLYNSDCPVLDSKLEKGIKGTCRDTSLPLKDDSNTVLKVNRDRTCAAWLACDSARTTWDAGSNKYIQICDSVNLCTQTGSQGDQAQCASWTARTPVVMTEQLYASRDVSWAGVDYSGYEIPHQLPTERFSQFNLNPKKWCVDGNGNVGGNKNSCEKDSECAQGWTCGAAPLDYRIVYNAGPCTGSSSCQVGFCKNTKTACASNANCGTDVDATNFCVFGYCQAKGANCSKADNTECAGTATPICDTVQGVCVNHLVDHPSLTDACSSENACAGGQTCVAAATTAFGSCYQNRCLTDIRDTDGDGFSQPLDKDQADDSQSCRGYPEFDSPFPQKVVAQWKVPPFDPSAVNAVTGYQSVSGLSIIQLPSDLASPSQFVSGYNASKVCTPIKSKDVDGKDVWIANDNCICSYTKATYAKGAEDLYFPTDTSMLESGRVPEGICTGGLLAGRTCKTDKSCTIPEVKDGAGNVTTKEIPGTCQLLTSSNTMFGWQGYCLEKDSSIQLNGSTAAKDQACLTWLPVDQLSGATDLYGKETSAGYQVASNTYYCAQPGVAWNLQVSGVACAETDDGSCDDGGNSLLDDMNDDKPYLNAFCPKGYFAILGPCGSNDPGNDKDGNGYCNQHSGDDDYPYYCVPTHAYHADGITECKAPYTVGGSAGIPKPGGGLYFNLISDLASATKTIVGGGSGYFTSVSDFKAAVDYYKDCQVRGVIQSSTINTYFGDKTPGAVPSSDSGHDGSNSYYNLTMHDNSYAACKSVAQVGSTGSSGDLNAAWTDRVWQGKKPLYTISTGFNDNFAGYKLDAEPKIFGQAKDIVDISLDPAPDKILMCDNEMSLADTAGKCTDPKGVLSTPNEGRAFSKVSLVAQNGGVDSNWCSSKACTCNPSQGVADCNNFLQNVAHPCSFKSILCVGTWNCVNNKCDGGPSKGGACGDSSDCSLSACSDAAKSTACNKAGGKCQGTGTCSNTGGPTGTDKTQTTSCNSDFDCQVNKCVPNPNHSNGTGWDDANVCINKDSSYGAYTVSQDFSVTEAKNRLKQIFAEAYSLQTFDDVLNTKGKYKLAPANDPDVIGWKDQGVATGIWDSRATANGTHPPIITSLGSCIGTSCIEKTPGKFNVNGEDSGVVEGLGSKHVSVTFYVNADTNQMPLRNVVIDWGDDMQGVSGGGNPWPNGSESGSTVPSNFYKNHRGLSKTNPPKELCDGSTFGQAPEACSSSYILFTHDYVCSSTDVAALQKAGRTCGTVDPKTKSIITSPCVTVDPKGVASCEFQPRIHAKDNWGWCTGYCDANPSDGTTSCFGGECAIDLYPSSGVNLQNAPLDKKSSGKIVNPWIYFEGSINIMPVQ
ncbi:MAG: hypothetical protein NTX72_05215 [Candidatus Uhrbacteria bacterium]|nr:hypothetical protein [Candidatus Uhrbacteria bacterium]